MKSLKWASFLPWSSLYDAGSAVSQPGDNDTDWFSQKRKIYDIISISLPS